MNIRKDNDGRRTEMEELIGSPKQVVWANQIRQRQLAEIERVKTHLIRGKRFADETSCESQALAELLALTDASVWIRRRHNSGEQLLNGVVAGIKLATN